MAESRVAWSLGASIAVVVAAIVAVVVLVSRVDVRACSLLAANPTVTVQLTSADRADIVAGSVKACDGDHCGSAELSLRPCDDAATELCSEGARRGSATIRDLSDETSIITVTLRSAAGTVTDSVEATPRMVYPNGKGCGGEAPHASVTWSDDGLKAS